MVEVAVHTGAGSPLASKAHFTSCWLCCLMQIVWVEFQASWPLEWARSTHAALQYLRVLFVKCDRKYTKELCKL